MKFGKKSILGGKNYKVGREFVANVLKQRKELNEILGGMCKQCRKRAKRAVMGKKIPEDYSCDSWVECKVLIERATNIGMRIGEDVKVD